MNEGALIIIGPKAHLPLYITEHITPLLVFFLLFSILLLKEEFTAQTRGPSLEAETTVRIILLTTNFNQLPTRRFPHQNRETVSVEPFCYSETHYRNVLVTAMCVCLIIIELNSSSTHEETKFERTNKRERESRHSIRDPDRERKHHL